MNYSYIPYYSVPPEVLVPAQRESAFDPTRLRTSLILGALLSAGLLGSLWFLQQRALRGIPYVTGPELERLARRAAMIEKLYGPVLMVGPALSALDIAYHILRER